MIAIKRPVQTFLPRSQAIRASAHLEIGYGSHYHTGKFQPKRAPVLAIAGGAFAIGSGVALGATTLAGALTIAGGVASLVGSFTGNKFLTQFGAVAGVAGGLTGAFSSGAGGTFNYNPFKDGFAGSQLGAAAAKTKSFFSDVFGSSDAVAGAGIDGQAIIGNATDSIPTVTGESFANEAASSFGGGAGIDLGKYSAGGPGVDLAGYGSNAASTVTAANTAAAASKGGLFASLIGNKDAMNLVSGAVDGYQAFQDRAQQQPLVDSTVDLREAQTDQTRFETDLAKNRYNNMQGQPNVNIGVNQDAQIFGNQPGNGTPRIAVAIGGKVEYLTTEQYAALQQQQQGGGLLAQGQANG
jgi:hypothetical protein